MAGKSFILTSQDEKSYMRSFSSLSVTFSRVNDPAWVEHLHRMKTFTLPRSSHGEEIAAKTIELVRHCTISQSKIFTMNSHGANLFSQTPTWLQSLDLASVCADTVTSFLTRRKKTGRLGREDWKDADAAVTATRLLAGNQPKTKILVEVQSPATSRPAGRYRRNGADV